MNFFTAIFLHYPVSMDTSDIHTDYFTS